MFVHILDKSAAFFVLELSCTLHCMALCYGCKMLIHDISEVTLWSSQNNKHCICAMCKVLFGNWWCDSDWQEQSFRVVAEFELKLAIVTHVVKWWRCWLHNEGVVSHLSQVPTSIPVSASLGSLRRSCRSRIVTGHQPAPPPFSVLYKFVKYSIAQSESPPSMCREHLIDPWSCWGSDNSIGVGTT